MFGKQNQFVTVGGFGVRVKDEREQDRNHIIEVTFEVPLTHELADEIMPAMARDLYQQVQGDWTPKPEINQAGFNMAPELQKMTVRKHPDLDPEFMVNSVGLRKVKAKKTDANSWVLHVTASWQLGRAAVEAVTVIQCLKQGIYLTFEQEQPNMLDGGGPADEAGAVAKVDKSGNVTDIKKGRGRGGRGKNRKKSPEEEGMEQEAAGAAAAAKDDGGDTPSDGGDTPTTH